MDGILQAASNSALVTLMDTFKQNLAETQKDLYVTQGGAYRIITGTFTDIKFPNEYFNLTWMPWTATFETTDAFWRDTTDQLLSFTGQTA